MTTPASLLVTRFSASSNLAILSGICSMWGSNVGDDSVTVSFDFWGKTEPLDVKRNLELGDGRRWDERTDSTAFG